MPVSKERVYYRAVRRVAVLMSSDVALKEVMLAVARGTARAMTAGASLVLLDSTRKKLVHTYSWGLPQYYIRKGLLDADKSLTEVITRQPVAITAANTRLLKLPQAICTKCSEIGNPRKH